jgi:CRISPR system Cascade subunit CasA
MTFSFNLIEQAWIPCVDLNGQFMELGLRDVLTRAHKLREVRSDTPLETASLHRVLFAVLHRRFGPKGKANWLNMWQRSEQGFDAAKLDEYFKKWRHRFDLFDDQHPFFQVPTQIQAITKVVKTAGQADKEEIKEYLFQTRIKTDSDSPNKMIAHVSSGNTATLFEHSLDIKEEHVTLSPAQAARTLVTVQNYGFGYQSFADAPCSKGIVFLVQGDTLFETLMLNLTRYPNESGEPDDSADDLPAWEQKNVLLVSYNGGLHDRDVVVTIDEKGDKTTNKRIYSDFSPLGRLDYFTWHNRKIQLFPEMVDGKVVVRKIAWTPGIRLRDDVTDPMQFWDRRDEGWQQKRFRPDRALWRDLQTLLTVVGSDKVRPIASIGWISDLAKTDPALLPKTKRLSAFGVAKSKASPILMRHEITPLPFELFRDDGKLARLGKAIKTAEKIRDVICTAAFLLAWVFVKPETNLEQLVQRESKEGDKRGAITLLKKILLERLRKGAVEDSKIKDEDGRIARRSYKLLASWGIERHYWGRLEAHFHRFVQTLPENPEDATTQWKAELRSAARAAFDQASAYVGGDHRAFRAQALSSQLFNITLAGVLGMPAQPTQQEQADLESVDADELMDDDEETAINVTDEELNDNQEGGLGE